MSDTTNQVIEQRPAPSATPTIHVGERGMVASDFEGMWRMATALSKSGMVPATYTGKPEAVLAAIQYGAELGLSPMTALSSIAVVNGRPAVWGDGLKALAWASGKCEGIDEELRGDGDAQTAICTVRRKGVDRPIVRQFSVADAKLAGLWGKPGPWKQYPARMMANRARAFALRDAFSDVLCGIAMAEEMQDVQPVRRVAVAEPDPAMET